MGETMLQIKYIIKVKHFDSRTGSPTSRRFLEENNTAFLPKSE